MPLRDLLARVPMPFFTLGIGAILIIAVVYFVLAAALGLPPFAASKTIPVNVEILLDRSVVMGESLEEGTRKIDAATQAIDQKVLSSPEGAKLDNLALRQYGGPCQGDNSQLLVEIGPENRQDVRSALSGISPEGDTTFVDGLVQAIRDFGKTPVAEGGHNEIFVITGGGDSCGMGEAAASIRQEMDLLAVPVSIRIIGLEVPVDQRANIEALSLAVSGIPPVYVSSSIELETVLTELIARAVAGAGGVLPGGNLPGPVAPTPGSQLITPDPNGGGSNGENVQQILVVKEVTNDEGGAASPSDFTIVIAGNNPTPATFAGDTNGTLVTLGTGAYQVSATGPAGYNQSLSSGCSGTLEPGQKVSCTHTSDDIAPTLTVLKNVINDDAGTAIPADFTLRIDGNPVASGVAVTLNAGVHGVSEDPSAGYTASIGGDCDAGGNITLSPGDNLTCTITNNDHGPADLSLSKTVVDATLSEMDLVTYTLVVTNQGPGGAFGIEVTDLLPAGVSFVTSDGAYDPVTGVWSVGDLSAPSPVPSTASLTIQAAVDNGTAGTVITAIAEITAAGQPDPDSTPGNADSGEDDQASASIIVGTLLAFVSDRDGNAEIYVMSATGTNQTRLTSNSGDDILPDWSPDGRKISFASDRDGDLEIFVMDIDGSNQIALTDNNANDVSPTWSPDGNMIAFASSRDGNFEIYIMGADGSGPVRLTNDLGADLNPSWSPDGSQITFASSRAGNFEIYVMDADGSNLVNISNNASSDTLPDWSPNGGQITFASDRDGNPEIYVMDADGSNPVRLTTSAADDFYPEWSGDGSKITFRSDRDGNLEIYSMKSNGSDLTRLTSNPAPDYYPVWSPDPS